jgi:hypothetical protein
VRGKWVSTLALLSVCIGLGVHGGNRVKSGFSGTTNENTFHILRCWSSKNTLERDVPSDKHSESVIHKVNSTFLAYINGDAKLQRRLWWKESVSGRHINSFPRLGDERYLDVIERDWEISRVNYLNRYVQLRRTTSGIKTAGPIYNFHPLVVSNFLKTNAVLSGLSLSLNLLQSAYSHDDSSYAHNREQDSSTPSNPIEPVSYGHLDDIHNYLWGMGILALIAISLEIWGVILLWKSYGKSRRGWWIATVSLIFWFAVGISGPIGCLPWDWHRCLCDDQQHSEQRVQVHRDGETLAQTKRLPTGRL